MAESPVVCRHCGTANPPGNNFCGQCGTYMASRPSVPAARPRQTAPGAEEARNRRNIAIIYTITAIFVLSCILLSLVVIIWRP